MHRLSFLLLALGWLAQAGGSGYASWSDYGGASDSAQYSSLRQIDRSNVKQLKVAWTYPTGDDKRYAFNPLFAHGLLYVLARNNSILALDAATGRQVWIHSNGDNSWLITNRGINYWESPDGNDRRLLFSLDNCLQELDARTGQTISSFGDHGHVDLREGLGREKSSLVLVQSHSPGRVFENLIILGSATNQEYESAPGDIRAYDVLTGRLVWSFHTIPHPGEFGYETWPADAWKRVGGANAWSEMSIDNKHGIVYVPTGSPKYNFYGANRKGANLFGDCLLALDARTGKRLWHFQMVHHDIWDYDNATAPKLLTVRHNGTLVDAVAQPSKLGFLYVFNRLTGEPLWPIEERRVPPSQMPNEAPWPTQPFPTYPQPFSRQKFTAADLSPYIDDPAERAAIRDQILSARNEGLFTPPGLTNTIQMPGNNGGANWGGAAADPARGMVFIVSKDLPAMLKLIPERSLGAPVSGSPLENGLAVYRAKCQICHHADLKGQPPAVPALLHLAGRLSQDQAAGIVQHGRALMPAVSLQQKQLKDLLTFLYSDGSETASAEKDARSGAQLSPVDRYRSSFGFMTTKSGQSPIAPPWTSLTAYELNSGAISWKIPLGDVPELAKRGIHNTGTQYPKLGPVVTAGGLIFTGTRDRKVRALDENTGEILWETELGAGLEGMPAVYETGGREYIVFCAAAQSETAQLWTPKAGHVAESQRGAYVAFALPQAGTGR